MGAFFLVVIIFGCERSRTNGNPVQPQPSLFVLPVAPVEAPQISRSRQPYARPPESPVSPPVAPTIDANSGSYTLVATATLCLIVGAFAGRATSHRGGSATSAYATSSLQGARGDTFVSCKRWGKLLASSEDITKCSYAQFLEVKTQIPWLMQARTRSSSQPLRLYTTMN